MLIHTLLSDSLSNAGGKHSSDPKDLVGGESCNSGTRNPPGGIHPGPKLPKPNENFLNVCKIPFDSLGLTPTRKRRRLQLKMRRRHYSMPSQMVYLSICRATWSAFACPSVQVKADEAAAQQAAQAEEVLSYDCLAALL